MRAVNVLNPAPEVALDVLAEEIVKLSKAADTLLRTRLTDKALLLLLSHASGVPQKTCKAVLLAASTLAKDYVRR